MLAQPMGEQLSLHDIAEYLLLDLDTVRWLACSQGWAYIEKTDAQGTERKYIVASFSHEVQLQIVEGFNKSKDNRTWV